MILECACGKMYKVKDDAANKPKKCKACGGDLKPAAGSGTFAAAGGKEQELESRVKQLERELEIARSTDTSDDASEKLRQELLDAEQKIRDSERKNSEIRGELDREKADRKRLESEALGSEKTQSKAVEEKQKTIKALEASISDYRAKIDSLQTRLDKVEMQRLADVNSFDNRLREREQTDRDSDQKKDQEQQKALTELHEEFEKKISEKDLQISDSRQAIDREAGERRRLNEVLTRLQETADRTVKEKEQALQGLEKSIESYKSKLDTLQKRADSLEKMRRSESDAYAQRLRSIEAVEPRVTEASHLASDVDHSLDGMAEVLTGLRDRVKRLKETLVIPRTSASMPSTATFASASSFTAEEAPGARPPLSQASSFGFAPDAPASAETTEEPAEAEPETAAEAEESAPEIIEQSAAEKEAPAVLEEVPEGIVEAPSEVVPAQKPEEFPGEEELQLAEEPAAEEEAASAEAEVEPLAESAAEEDPSDLPLISPPEETPRDPIRTVEAPPKKAPSKPEPKKKSRFSWKRK